MLCCVAGFTRVMIDRGEEEVWQHEQWANSRGMLNATKVKAVFARLVREAVRVQWLERYRVYLCKILQLLFVTVLLQKTGVWKTLKVNSE